ncbi:MAG: VWA domain-containing protein [Puniceicoccales bacterium]|jgi:Ca-activated chloride channel family protein|nr:VWA domain-containing protein [Puniceicoccales bacterium]
MEETFAFKHPWILIHLFWIPLIFVYWLKTWTPPKSLIYTTANEHPKIQIPPHVIPLFFRSLCLASILLGIAQPQRIYTHRQCQSSGIDLILALDLSSSMRVPDFMVNQFQRVTRIQAAKAVIAEFIQQRQHDRIGLVTFARYPYLVSPLTLNHAWLLKNLDRLNAGLIEDGTAIGSAITMCVNRLKDLQAKTRVIILLTDGVNNCGNVAPIMAAEAAEHFQTKIYTIVVGNDQFFPVDEQTLVQVAEKTGGRFYRAYDVSTLKQIYQEIDQLEKTKISLEGYTTCSELFTLCLWLALVFFSLEQILKNSRYRTLP